MGIPVIAGRGIRTSDNTKSPGVAVVSQSFAAKYLGGQDSVGHHLSLGGKPHEIIGVVGDVQQHSGITGQFGPIAVEPTVYLPVEQTHDGFVTLVHTWFSPKGVIRTSGPSPAITA